MDPRNPPVGFQPGSNRSQEMSNSQKAGVGEVKWAGRFGEDFLEICSKLKLGIWENLQGSKYDEITILCIFSGGGFKSFLWSPLFGEDFQFD